MGERIERRKSLALSAIEIPQEESSTAGAPHIILLSKHPDPQELKRLLRRRGFLVENHVVYSSLHSCFQCVLSLSEKLYIKLLVEMDLPLVRYKECKPLDRLLLNNGIESLLRRHQQALSVVDVWIAHDKRTYEALLSQQTTSPSWGDSIRFLFQHRSKVNEIFHYFGPQVAVYFAWLDHYTENLYLPAIAGALVFAHQWSTMSSDTPYMPLYAILIAIWSTTFMEFWKRKCSTQAYEWGVLNLEDDEMDEELAMASEKETSSVMRLVLSYLVTLSVLFLLICCMLYYVDCHMAASTASSYWLRLYPSVIYSFTPSIFPMLFEPIVSILNRFEAHATPSSEENSLILKRFALQFVNNFCGLLYTAFYRRDLSMLRSLLISLLVTKAVSL